MQELWRNNLISALFIADKLTEYKEWPCMLQHGVAWHQHDHYSPTKCAGIIWTTVIAVIKCNVYVRAISAAVSPAYICDQLVGGFASWVRDTALGNGVLATLYVSFQRGLFCNVCYLGVKTYILKYFSDQIITFLCEHDGECYGIFSAEWRFLKHYV